MANTDTMAFGHADGVAGKTACYGDSYCCNNLAAWFLTHSRGLTRWSVSLCVRGLAVSGTAVVDDFGDLQIVAAT
ncbi:hypothetical protein [uncultured Pseudacidovorax sp.]|uniref:hypothetical protein n=1 Tax=uncultured Pseudacidovorax sp. TaxID=679313 RepID=UPI0025D033FE|nr:hypothetical protein [uncultured Pseudacidovorax sp.]